MTRARSRRWPLGLLAVLVSAGLGGPASAKAYLPVMGGKGGGQFDQSCGISSLIGFELRVGDDVDAIRPLCANLRDNGGVTRMSFSTSGSGLRVVNTEFGPETQVEAEWHGGIGGRIVTLVCPTETPVVLGIDVAWEGVDTIIVNNIHLYCGRITEAPQVPAAYPSAVFDAPGYTPSRPWLGLGPGGSTANSGQGSERCPPGQLANGVYGRSGKWLDAIGLTCGTPILFGSPGGSASLLGRAPVKSIGRVNRPRPGDPGPAPRGTLCDAAADALARHSAAAPNLEKQCLALRATPIRSIGRENQDTTGANAPLRKSLCDAAADARARNAPTAAHLEEQCRAAGGPKPPPAPEEGLAQDPPP